MQVHLGLTIARRINGNELNRQLKTVKEDNYKKKAGERNKKRDFDRTASGSRINSPWNDRVRLEYGENHTLECRVVRTIRRIRD